MEVFGDVLLTEGEVGGNIQFKDGQPVMDAGIESFVYISLFSNGYWGNEIVDRNGEILEEGLDVLSRNKVSAQTRIDYIDRATNLLKPMIEMGLADAIEIDAFLGVEEITLTIDIYKNEVSSQYKYLINWNNQLNDSAINRL